MEFLQGCDAALARVLAAPRSSTVAKVSPGERRSPVHIITTATRIEGDEFCRESVIRHESPLLARSIVFVPLNRPALPDSLKVTAISESEMRVVLVSLISIVLNSFARFVFANAATVKSANAF